MIVLSTGKQYIDRMASLKKLQLAIPETEEFINLEILKGKIQDSKIPADRKKLKAELAVLSGQMRDRIKSLQPGCTEFFQIKDDESMVSDQEYSEYRVLLAECKAEGKLLRIDKVKIYNLKNKAYYLKDGNNVTKHLIGSIGEGYPEGAILDPSRADKIAAMGVEENLSEYNCEKSIILNKISSDSLSLQMDGVEESVAKEQAMQAHQEEYDDLKSLYGQS